MSLASKNSSGAEAKVMLGQFKIIRKDEKQGNRESLSCCEDSDIGRRIKQKRKLRRLSCSNQTSLSLPNIHIAVVEY